MLVVGSWENCFIAERKHNLLETATLKTFATSYLMESLPKSLYFQYLKFNYHGRMFDGFAIAKRPSSLVNGGKKTFSGF